MRGQHWRERTILCEHNSFSLFGLEMREGGNFSMHEKVQKAWNGNNVSASSSVYKHKYIYEKMYKKYWRIGIYRIWNQQRNSCGAYTRYKCYLFRTSAIGLGICMLVWWFHNDNRNVLQQESCNDHHHHHLDVHRQQKKVFYLLSPEQSANITI